jgi:cell division inhibitor SulA
MALRGSDTRTIFRPPTLDQLLIPLVTASCRRRQGLLLVYLAKDEAIIHKHAQISGFPATKIIEVKKMIDPATATS